MKRTVSIRPKVPIKIEKQRQIAEITAQCVRKRLTAAEDEACAKLADQRVKYAREADRKDGRVATDLSGYEIDLMGCKGELATCKYLGIDWEPVVDRPDGGVDIVLPGGATIDVKSALKIGHRLLFKRLEAFRADIAVLAYAHPAKRDVYLAGWCTREEFLAGHTRIFACKNAPGLEARQLHPMESLERAA